MAPEQNNAGQIRRLIFDLDDTLFDTFNQLVNSAAVESCQSMVMAGLNATLDEALFARHDFVLSGARIDVFKKIAQHFGAKNNEDITNIAKAGFNAFHNREVKENISLFPGIRDLLKDLGKKYEIFLVTLGGIETQQKKIHLLNLNESFIEIFYVDISKEKNKKSAFKKILSRIPILPPHAHLSIGNRIDSEIRDAKELGMRTVLIPHGEHRHLAPENQNEIPDYEINNLSELLKLIGNLK